MIKAEDYLSRYIRESRPFLDSFLEKQQEKAGRISPIAAKMVETYHRFIGGKRLRGALTYGSYKMFGGKAEAEILKVASIIEIIHAFGLMHDDIMDEDDRRRGQPTVHIQYENIFRQEFAPNTRKSPEHFGVSMALDVGDLGSFLGNLVLDEATFPPEIKLNFLKQLSETIITTLYGQALDVTFEADLKPTLTKVLQVHRYKTADYTITGPLRYGAILAGTAPRSKNYRALGQYGTPVGIAFQLRDDELGLFSTPEKLGKPVVSDLREGKNTLLFLKVFETGTPDQKEFLRSVHGHPQVSAADLERVKRIVIETGALEYSQKEGRRLVNQGKKIIPLITDDKNHQELLEVLADYVISRDS